MSTRKVGSVSFDEEVIVPKRVRKWVAPPKRKLIARRITKGRKK